MPLSLSDSSLPLGKDLRRCRRMDIVATVAQRLIGRQVVERGKVSMQQAGINVRVLTLVIALALLPSRGWSQSATTGAIAGVVKDTTGAVLPGVTVEAASPALIE